MYFHELHINALPKSVLHIVPFTVPADELAGYFRHGTVCSQENALPLAREYAGKDGLVLIAGSLLMDKVINMVYSCV